MANSAVPDGATVIYRQFITVNGKRIYRANGRPFRIVIREGTKAKPATPEKDRPMKGDRNNGKSKRKDAPRKPTPRKRE
ncbi:hypothetical protein [Chitinolyticbacter meiyuanensis]|uniref:hypothetical protein n=1 Tax=Chitinolyticbacter meiyuanensis TaxID=682798 RepID=UPI0011E5B8A2|nr:hypothetical protein [Chitinolyticbacter meiyuanensis]